jgi:hypothetical protein
LQQVCVCVCVCVYPAARAPCSNRAARRPAPFVNWRRPRRRHSYVRSTSLKASKLLQAGAREGRGGRTAAGRPCVDDIGDVTFGWTTKHDTPYPGPIELDPGRGRAGLGEFAGRPPARRPPGDFLRSRAACREAAVVSRPVDYLWRGDGSSSSHRGPTRRSASHTGGRSLASPACMRRSPASHRQPRHRDGVDCADAARAVDCTFSLGRWNTLVNHIAAGLQET